MHAGAVPSESRVSNVESYQPPRRNRHRLMQRPAVTSEHIRPMEQNQAAIPIQVLLHAVPDAIVDQRCERDDAAGPTPSRQVGWLHALPAGKDHRQTGGDIYSGEAFSLVYMTPAGGAHVPQNERGTPRRPTRRTRTRSAWGIGGLGPRAEHLRCSIAVERSTSVATTWVAAADLGGR
jgi:hypothetical protein